MSIALGALILFLILLPGIVLRIAYLNGPFSKRNIQSSIVDELILSLIPALILQGGGFLFSEHCLNFDVNLEVIYQLIIGSSVKDYRPDFSLIEQSISRLIFYNIVLATLAIILGKIARYVVNLLRLDIRFPSLRFYNEWYYLFSGRIKDFPTQEGSSEGIADFPFLNVVVEYKEATYIYRGLLLHYILSKDGLDRIYMSNVYRRRLDKDDCPDPKPETLDQDNRYYFIPGEFFVLPFSQIKNLNVEYFSIEKIEEDKKGRGWIKKITNFKDRLKGSGPLTPLPAQDS